MIFKAKSRETGIRSRAWMSLFGAGLILSACADGGTREVETQVAGQPATKSEMVTSCDNYGQAVTNAQVFLKEHEADQNGLPPEYTRSVVVKTLYTASANTWLATIVEGDGSVKILGTTAYHDIGMAALITIGDYIAFDNKDGDYRVPAPQLSGEKSDELRLLGHGVLAC